jgi:hypothetical protein
MSKRICIILIFAMLVLCTSTSIAQNAKRLKIEEFLGDTEAESLKAGDRWALLVGVNKYDDPEVNTLRYAVADAKALYNLLTDPDRGRFSPDKVKLLTSDATDKRARPTKANILWALKEWLARNVKAEDTVLIFFSGHGYVDGDRKYLLPIDTDTFYVPAYAIDNREFIEGIDKLKAEKIITLLDSCHSGGVSRAGKGVGDVLSDDFYQEFEKAKGRVTLASCSGAEQSFEWPEKGHGVFTYYLLEGLQGAANKHRDSAVTFDEVAEYVEQNVEKWARENKNGRQNPRRHMESGFGKIALSFDLATGFAMVSEKMKEKLYSYLGTGADNLSVKEVADAEKVLTNIASRLKQSGQVSQSEENALAVISDLVKGNMSIDQYKKYGSRLIQDALEPNPLAQNPLAPAVQYGEIKILVKNPWADIYLDRQLVGQSPKVIKDVKAGKHTLTLKHPPSGKETTREIDVVPNGTLTIKAWE